MVHKGDLYCPFCGAKMDQDERICARCGRENSFGGLLDKELFPPPAKSVSSGFEMKKIPQTNRGFEMNNNYKVNSDKTARVIIGCVLCVILNIIVLFIRLSW